MHVSIFSEEPTLAGVKIYSFKCVVQAGRFLLNESDFSACQNDISLCNTYSNTGLTPIHSYGFLTYVVLMCYAGELDRGPCPCHDRDVSVY